MRVPLGLTVSLLFVSIAWAGVASAEVVLVGARTVASGDAPALRLEGLAPREVVRVHALRKFSRWADDGTGRWVESPAVLHAWADYQADARGTVNLARAAPIRGTYSGPDPLGLLWSGHRRGSPELAGVAAPDIYAPAQQQGAVYLSIVRRDAVAARAELRFVEPPGLRVVTVAEPGLNGVFAAPADGRVRPALVLLHGSEGGGAEEARAMATRYAAKGYAALAVNYFAWDLKGLTGIPNVHVNHPIENLERARAWLATRPEADIERFGVYGHSKGAEFAEVASVRYPWIDAIAACVPTDVVWEGYGVGDGRNRQTISKPNQVSSWSYGGVPLPYVPLRPIVLGAANPYFSNTERYERSRADHPDQTRAAEIPIERAKARFLLLGGERDQVWDSGAMTRRLAARMRKAGRGAEVETKVYQAAGHGICGDGSFPPRLYGEPSEDPRRPDLTAEGAASGDAWRRIQAFFKRSLHP